MAQIHRLLISVITAFVIAFPGGTLAGTGFDISQLPDLGDASSKTFSPREQAHFGKEIVRQMREAGMILEDPDVEEYVQSLGQHLAAHSSRPGEDFHFFVMRADGINAFALPGGYIGLNAGLILAADTEAELAGVVAHEIAHVTQRHIARQMDAMRGSGLATLGAILAAMVIAAQTGHGEAAMAGAISAQALSIQRQINHTRAHEYEADRIGIGILAEAGYDPQGMVAFFQKLHRQTQHTAGAALPEYLRTHPLTSARITEARNRADEKDFVPRPSSRRFYIARERVNAHLSVGGQRELVRLNPVRAPADLDLSLQLELYQQAITNQFRSRHEDAIRGFSQLAQNHPDVIAYHLGWAESLIADGQNEKALSVYKDARRLFPNNEPLLESHARSLLDIGKVEEALDILERLVQLPGTQARHHRLMARAHSQLNNQGESHYHMAGFHLVQGNVYGGLTQMQLAYAHPILDAKAEERYERRMAQLRRQWDLLPNDIRRAQQPRREQPDHR